MKPNFLNEVQIYVFDNFITEYEHGKNQLVIKLILTILNKIKFDYTMGIKFLQF